MPQSPEEYLRASAAKDLQKLRESLIGLQDEARKLATIDLDRVGDSELAYVADLSKKLVESSSFIYLSLLIINVMGHDKEDSKL